MFRPRSLGWKNHSYKNTHESNELEFAPSSSSKETRLVRSPREMRFLSDRSDNNTLPKMGIMIGRTPLGAQMHISRTSVTRAKRTSLLNIIVHGVCPARLAAFFSEERGCAALSQEPAWGLRLFAALAPPGAFFGEIVGGKKRGENRKKQPPPLAVGGGHVAVFAAPPWRSRRSFADTAGGHGRRSFLVFQFGG